MIHCEIITTLIECDGKEVQVYGFDFYKDKDILPFKTVKDIFIEIKAAQALRELINANDVSELHIDEIIDNFIE